MLTRAPAKLSIAFADPDVEKAYLKLVRENRKSGDTLAFTICTIVYIKFYVCGVFEGPAAILLWFCSTLILACLVSFSIGLISRHPYVLQWKPFLMPPLGICGNIALKLMAPLSYRSLKFDGSLLRGIPVIATISRATHCFVALGLWSTTGSTFFTDLALMASLQVTNFTWNKKSKHTAKRIRALLPEWRVKDSFASHDLDNKSQLHTHCQPSLLSASACQRRMNASFCAACTRTSEIGPLHWTARCHSLC
eukprot:jgi/Botrbrau1/17531/Bobra.0529s0002.2